jgi:hypothetical protein
MLAIARPEHKCSKSNRWLYGFSLSNLEKESPRTIAIRSGRSSQPDVMIIGVEGGGSKNSPLGVESC